MLRKRFEMDFIIQRAFTLTANSLNMKDLTVVVRTNKELRWKAVNAKVYLCYFIILFFNQKPTKYKAPYSRDSKLHYKLRGKIVPGLRPIEALTQQQGE